jgi:hypothetical protein
MLAEGFRGTEIPVGLDDWSFLVVRRLCANGQAAGDRYLLTSEHPDSASLTKTCCDFANSRGGFIVVGVRNDPPFWFPAGMDSGLRVARTFEARVRAQPPIEWHGPLSIQVPGGLSTIEVFHVPASQGGPHVPISDTQQLQ